MAVGDKIISFWKQVKLRSSDMFTLFKVGVGVKVPTHKFHVKDSTDPVKIEGLQNDATDPDKFLTIDTNNILKYRTGAQVLTDIGGTPLTTEEVQDIAGALVATGGTKTGITVTYDDANNDMDFVVSPTTTVKLEVRNDEGTTISAGSPLYSKGEIGGSGRILVGVADADNAAKMPCIGIAESEMDTGDGKDNYAISQGIYNTNISGFTGLAVGDNLYVSIVGTLLQSKPTGETGLIQNVGIVLKTNGSICQGLLVSAIGRTNDVPNLDQNALFIGNGSNQAVATDAPMVGVITAANAGAARTVLGVDAAGTDNSTNVTLAGSLDYITISGQEITRNAIDVTADVSGTLPVANGGTGATSLAADSILTGNGTNAIVAESRLTYSAEILSIGEPDAGDSTITRNNGAATNGGGLLIQSGRGSGGTNLTGGDLTLRGGPGTGNGASGNIVFGAGVPTTSGSGVQNVQEIGTLDSTGNLSIDGDLTVKGNDIKDDDGTTCITFDSSGNTTIANTLNASVTGNVTGNASGSSGSCTGNAATATSLAAGNQTIDGNLTIGANEAGHDFKLYGDTSLATVLWDSTYDFLKFSDLTKIVFGSGVAAADFDSSIQADGSNLVIYNDTGNIQIGDTVEVTGDLTVSGDLSIGNDAEITSVGSMVFRIDSDNDETGQSFTWKDNASDTIATLNEAGEFTMYGSVLADPLIRLEQTDQTPTYGPPVFEFVRNAVNIDNADIGRTDYIARDSGGTLTTYAQIIGGTEESGAGTEGGKLRLLVATHDGEMQAGITVEDGDAEDEIDVTIANGASSLTTVSGNLTVTNDLTYSGSLNGKQREIYFNNFEDKIGTSKVYIPLISALEQSSPGLEEACFLAPCDGRIVSVTVRPHIISSGSDCTVTVDVSTMGLNASSLTTSNWVAEESKQHTMQGADDYHAFHYVFDNAKHFESGELVALGIQSDVAPDSGPYTMYWYVSTVVEYDWNNQGLTAHQEYDSAQ
jgi:hypothetical protein